MNEKRIFFVGILIMFLTMIIVGSIMPEPEIMGGCIIFMGINYLIYVLIRLKRN